MASFPSMRSWVPGDLATNALLNSQIRDPIAWQKSRPHHFITDTANFSHTSSGNWQIVTWNTDIPDEPDAHGTSNSYITCQVSGLYDIRCVLFWNANATGGRAMRFINHGSTSIGGVAGTSGGAASGTTNTIAHAGMMSSSMTPDGATWTGNTVESGQELSVKRLLQAGDAIRVEAYQNSGGTLAIQRDYTNSNIHSYFSFRWLAQL